MRITKSAMTNISIALATTVSTARAFSAVASKVPNSSRFMAAAAALPIPPPRKNNKHIRKSTALPMIFDKLFSSLGGGGSFAATVDYTTMPFPVPDIATAAQKGISLEEIDINDKTLKLATFAGGCFWGLELAYQRIPGVEYTGVGYTQGPEIGPTYDQVSAGATKHTEAVIVLYDPNQCSYEQLLDTFFKRVDPLTVNGQGNDRGLQYRTGVYYHSKEQEQIAKARFTSEQTKYAKRKIATECSEAMPFWPAEKYHQQYLKKGGQRAEKGCVDTIRCYG